MEGIKLRISGFCINYDYNFYPGNMSLLYKLRDHGWLDLYEEERGKVERPLQRQIFREGKAVRRNLAPWRDNRQAPHTFQCKIKHLPTRSAYDNRELLGRSISADIRTQCSQSQNYLKHARYIRRLLLHVRSRSVRSLRSL